ncbi:hypothetical protein BT67DRAFT_409163 [Trichocladium antarcticum]|uniref:Transcriptional regulator n=1 Tax=Trichocladium antarcticum TaxID=1450529 RepID=A0AAN6ZAX9_9PEZI|nr:hypothetical protein BT67DRAFT_409163 [Trichocladium antarcticum]
MAPVKATDKTIAKELANVVRDTFNGPDSDQLTVNYVRQAVEEKLMLDDGFLKEGSWKAKSKQIIVDTLKDDSSDPEDEPEPPVKKRKTVKGQNARSEITSDDEGDNLPDVSEEENPQPKQSAGNQQSKQPSASESDLSDVPDETADSEPQSEKEDTPAPPADDSSSELSSVIDDPPERKQKPKAKPASKAKPPAKSGPHPAPPKEDTTKNDPEDSSSDLSSVLDDPPPVPKGRKRKSSATTTTQKQKSNTKSTAANPSPDELQIKTLQTQLSKCGVRKVWAFEFKKRGDDTAGAKIRTLKAALAEVGMTGRFSEARARELKEMRELQADLHDVVQGEKSWGLAAKGGRGLRRGLRAGGGEGGVGSGGEEGLGSEDEDEDEDEGGKPAVRGRVAAAKRRADLAFLEDESESD